MSNEIHRSKTTIVANTRIDSGLIIDALTKKGMILGSGYGSMKKSQIRLANFPTHSKEQIEMLSDELLSINI